MPTLEHPDTFASNRKLLVPTVNIRCNYCKIETKPAARATVVYDFGDGENRYVCPCCYDRIRFEYEPTHAELLKQ